MLHLGTLLAVVVYFWKDIVEIFHGIRASLRRGETDERGIRLLLWITVATIPTELIVLFFKDWFESFFSQPKLVGAMLLITGTFLWLTRWTKKEGRTISRMKWVDSVLIGTAQGIAILPGISRSGATISTGLFCGLDRELSARFSFLLSVPAILGATLLEFKGFDSIEQVWIILIGTAVAFGVGIFSLKFLIKINRIGKIFHFSYYCWIIGILIIIFS
jgi:undecaprenyl-diphosphatase